MELCAATNFNLYPTFIKDVNLKIKKTTVSPILTVTV